MHIIGTLKDDNFEELLIQYSNCLMITVSIFRLKIIKRSFSMKVPHWAYLLLFFESVLAFRGRQYFNPYKKYAHSKSPVQISYQYHKNEFDLSNSFDSNSVFDGQFDMDLEPRFRSSAADVSPMKVSCESQNVVSNLKELISQVTCKPRDAIVDLKAPIGFIVSPNTVLAKKCGGMCNGAMNCVSAKSREVTFFVRAHNLQNNEVSCSSISVPEDTSCKCGCQTKMTDCLPTQKYDKATCTCRCINREEYNQCIFKSNMGFKWDEKSCRCICGVSKTCTTGSEWVPSQCRCAKIYT